VLGGVGHGEVRLGGKLLDRTLALRENVQELQPVRIAECPADSRELVEELILESPLGLLLHRTPSFKYHLDQLNIVIVLQFGPSRNTSRCRWQGSSAQP
jgi:hypothetical protein